MTRAVLLAMVGVLVPASGCNENALQPGHAAVFEIDHVGERFHVAVGRESVEAELQEFAESGDTVPVLFGDLLPGDGGFNAPYDWHLDPATVEVVDLSIELCDGTPSFVQEELDYWLESVTRYCPWGPTVVRRVEPGV